MRYQIPDTRCQIPGPEYPLAGRSRCLYESGVGDYRKLRVWQLAREFTKDVYELTRGYPRGEEFGLVAQLRRASGSIGANIAEGFGRSSDRDTARFIGFAIGSANEIEQHLATSADVGYLSPESASALSAAVAEIRRMLVGLQKTVRSRIQ